MHSIIVMSVNSRVDFMKKQRQAEIDDKIDNLLLQTNLSFPESSIGNLLGKLGILCSTSADLPDNVSGVIFFKDGQPFIAANKNDPIKRRVFTLAHELGHFILHPIEKGEEYRLDKYSYLPNDPNSQKEAEANYFAATLLVPKCKLKWALRQAWEAGRPDDTVLIAQYFGVTESVIINRLKWLGYDV